MATNKKPRKRYNPAKFCATKNKPRLDSVYHIFQPIYTFLDQLETGEIEFRNDRPMFKDFEGCWCDVAYAMRGWCDCFERISRNEGIEFDAEPLRRVAKKLDLGILLEQNDVVTFRAKVKETQRIFMSLPVEKTKLHTQTEQIQIEADRLKLTGSAYAS